MERQAGSTRSCDNDQSGVLEPACFQREHRARRGGLGYGNDSRQTGPLSSRILHGAHAREFALSVGTRPQRLTQRRATDSLILLTRPVFSAFSATFRSLAWSRRRRTEVGFAAGLRTPFLLAAEWARGILALLALRRERGQWTVSHKTMRGQALGRMAQFVANRCHTRMARPEGVTIDI